jgi:hypothetical protein
VHADLVAAFSVSEGVQARVHRISCPCHATGAVGLQIAQDTEEGHQRVAVVLDVRDALLLADRLAHAAHLAMQPEPSSDSQDWLQDVRVGVVPDPAPYWVELDQEELADSFRDASQNLRMARIPG